VERIDYDQLSLDFALRSTGTNLINYKTNEGWTITKDAAGKTVCTKNPPPGPQPNSASCLVPIAAPVRRGTQGPVEVTYFEGPYAYDHNITMAAAGEEALAENLLHYGYLYAPNASFYDYFHSEFEGYTTDAIPAAVFAVPPECQ